MSYVKSPKKLKIDLSILRTPELGNGIRVDEEMCQIRFTSSDQNVAVRIVTNEDILGKDSEELFNRDSLKASLTRKYQGCTIYNDAFAAGKNGYVHRYYDSFFEVGSLVSDATVQVINPDTWAQSNISVTGAAAAVAIVAGSAATFKATVQNKSSQTFYLGPASTVTDTGATKGYELLPGEEVEFIGTYPIYAYVGTTATIHVDVES